MNAIYPIYKMLTLIIKKMMVNLIYKMFILTIKNDKSASESTTK